MIRLGVNIDHYATLRELRNTPYPNLVEVCEHILEAGAHQITMHLREDRRHIQDQDVFTIKKWGKLPLNLESSCDPKMIRNACKVKPEWVCLVPEKREEVTTEGGLDCKKNKKRIEKAISELKKKKIKISLFLEPDLKAIQFAYDVGADAVEIHTGKYCILSQKKKISKPQIEKEKLRIQNAIKLGVELGLKMNLGHGLDDQNCRAFIFDQVFEANIGHWIVCRSSVVGTKRAVQEMLSALNAP